MYIIQMDLVLLGVLLLVVLFIIIAVCLYSVYKPNVKTITGGFANKLLKSKPKLGGDIEFEAKFLDVDVNAVREKLKKMGAKLVHPCKRYVRSVFHRCTNEIKGFARVRDEGGKVTMTVKTYADPKFPDETEIDVASSFEDATKVMTALGLQQKAFQETYREKWSLDDPEVHEITFDDVPGLPTYMEIDCTSEKKLNELIAAFDLDKSKMRFGAFDATYEEYYGIAKKDINDLTPSLTFANIEKEIKPTKNQDLLPKVAAEQREKFGNEK